MWAPSANEDTGGRPVDPCPILPRGETLVLRNHPLGITELGRTGDTLSYEHNRMSQN